MLIMKKYLFIVLVLTNVQCIAQDAIAILKKTEAYCKTIQNGTYEMDVFLKGLMSQDTTITKYNSKFIKLKEDSLSPVSFYSERIWKGKLAHIYIYNGDEFISMFTFDSSGTIMSKQKYSNEIKGQIKSADLFRPLVARKKQFFIDEEDYLDTSFTFIKLQNEVVNNISCYHIKVINKGESNAMGLTVNQVVFEFWIKEDDYFPIQYATTIDMMNGNIPMQQYTKLLLTKYNVNDVITKKTYDINDAPPYFRLKNYEPYQRKEQLANGTNAPSLKGKTVFGEKINLKDYKGKVVLIDFFYMACAPCILSFPHIKDIYNKYKDNGFVVIGVNPVDKKKDQFKDFLQKYNIQYPVILLDDAEMIKSFIIQGYPCFYLIDKEGKIAFSLPGFGQGVEKLIEENIKKLL